MPLKVPCFRMSDYFRQNNEVEILTRRLFQGPEASFDPPPCASIKEVTREHRKDSRKDQTKFLTRNFKSYSRKFSQKKIVRKNHKSLPNILTPK